MSVLSSVFPRLAAALGSTNTRYWWQSGALKNAREELVSQRRGRRRDDVERALALMRPDARIPERAQIPEAGWERAHEVVLADMVARAVAGIDAETRKGAVGGEVGASVAGAGTCELGVTRQFVASRAAMARAMGFALNARASTAGPDAGRGLFVHGGTARKGSLVALYPGVAYPLALVQRLQEVLQTARNDGFADNEYLVTSFDGTIIDARPFLALVTATAGLDPPEAAWNFGNEYGEVHACLRWPSMSSRWSSSQRLDGGNGALDVAPWNPLAMGHLANHPPRGVAPNAMLCHTHVRFDSLVAQSAASRSGGDVLPQLQQLMQAPPGTEEHAAASSLRALVPERLHVHLTSYTPPTVPLRLRSSVPASYCEASLDSEGSYEADVSLPVVAVVALRDLPPSTEVFLDYRLDALHGPHPPWYAPCS